jgi:hypothetical protein
MTKEEFKTSRLIYNNEGLWLVDPHTKPDGSPILRPLMHPEWVPILHKAIEALFNKIVFKSVLEIGYGAGESSNIFQSYNLAFHHIVEAHDALYEKALEWAKDKPSVIVHRGFIQDLKSEFVGKHFDLIFDDRFEMVHDEEIDWSWIDANCVSRNFGSSVYDPNIYDPADGLIFDSDGITYFQRLLWLK